MHIKLNKNLFWFLKLLKDEEGVSLDLSRPSEFEMGLQQVLSRGRAEDVKQFLRQVPFDQFKKTFSKIKHFLAWEVRKFWEDFIENN